MAVSQYPRLYEVFERTHRLFHVNLVTFEGARNDYFGVGEKGEYVMALEPCEPESPYLLGRVI